MSIPSPEGPFKAEQNIKDQTEYQRISDDVSDGDERATNMNADLLKSRSVDEILDETGLRFFHWEVFLLICVKQTADALGYSMLSVVLPSLKSDWNISSIMAGVLTLSISVGMTVGSPFWGWMSDKYGRKSSFVGSGTFILVFAFVSALSTNYYWLWISLFFVGFGTATVDLGYVVLMEFFPPKHRIIFSVLTTIFWSLGFLLSAVVSMELSVIGYHWALATVCFPTATFLIGSIVFLPESPHYYVAAGDEQKALNILQDLAPEMDLSTARLRKHDSETQRADFTQLFRSGYWKITICACIVTFGIAMTYDSVIYTASDVAYTEDNTSLTNGSQNDNMHAVMAWMNLPEIVIVLIAALSCYVVTIKIITLTITFLTILSQIITLFVVNQRMPLLIFTMLSRSFLATNTTLMSLFASLVYPTENRSIGVGTCFSVASIGTILGPFIFETCFAKTYLNGIAFNVVILSVTFIATVLLPSQTATLR